MAVTKPKGTVSPVVVLVWALVIIIIGLLIIHQQDEENENLAKRKEKYTMDYILAQQLKSEQDIEIRHSGSNDYISEKARENGFQYPGETSYIIINTNLLYDNEKFAQEGPQ